MGINTVGDCDCRCGPACSGCCNGSAPTEWEAEFTFADDPSATGCTSCVDFLSGTYILTKSTTGDCSGRSCCWTYTWSGTHEAACGTYVITDVRIHMEIQCNQLGTNSEIVVLNFYFLGYNTGTPHVARGAFYSYVPPYKGVGQCDTATGAITATNSGIWPGYNIFITCGAAATSTASLAPL